MKLHGVHHITAIASEPQLIDLLVLARQRYGRECGVG
jgi:hypothetical protein